jgi:hypothetical protein
MAETDFSLLGVINRLEPELAISVKQALSLIAESGVIQTYVELQAQLIAQNAVGVEDEELFAQIKRLRAESHGMILIHNYGHKLAQEEGI